MKAVRQAPPQALVSLLDFLRSSQRISHSGVSLYAHLLGTYEILSAWGADTATCLAGACHSIYATQYFKTAWADVSHRPQVATLIGVRAERLAYYFCHLSRDDMRHKAHALSQGHPQRLGVARHNSGPSLRIASADLRALLLIDAANDMEQLGRTGPEGWCLHSVWTTFQACGFFPNSLQQYAGVVTTSQQTPSLHARFEAALAVGPVAAHRALTELNQQVPMLAEPCIALAALAHRRRQYAHAYGYLETAISHLNAWGLAWDSRMSRAQWLAFCYQLQQASREHCPTRPDALDCLRAGLQGPA